MIFLTVGTQFPFDRLVKAVDEAVGRDLVEERIFAQIGNGSYRPLHFEAVAWLQCDEFDEWMRKASRVISHAGIGSIIAALENNKQLLVMPRRKQYKEHLNNHQVATAKRFEQDGYLLVAYEVEALPTKIEELKSFVPTKRENQVKDVSRLISTFLNRLYQTKNGLTKDV